mmetsp:Transcript_125757/g.361569  ORF Transcript_125757/g.361569 Transcript_125757/m.361569 type:complete len:213 (+) Transcript_125757:361-999(+)
MVANSLWERFGAQPGKEVSCSTEAPASRAARLMERRTSSNADCTDDLAKFNTSMVFGDVRRTRATLLEVSTRPAISWDLLMTPFGNVNNKSINFAPSLPLNRDEGKFADSTAEARKAKTGFMRPYSASRSRWIEETAPPNASNEDSSTATIAVASRGMALSKLPPPKSKSSRPRTSSRNCAMALAKSRSAFPRSSWMSAPEWPPFKPDNVMR